MPTVAFTPLSSDRIARRKWFLRGHARDVVVTSERSKRKAREPLAICLQPPPGDVDMVSVQGFEMSLQPPKDGFIVFWLIVPF